MKSGKKLKIIEVFKMERNRFFSKRPIRLVLLFILISACDSENSPDCFQTAGNLVRQDVVVPVFSKITVFENVSLVLKQGDEQKVTIETGKNLIEEVNAVVDGERLVLTDTNDCNYFRDYETTTVFVTAPNISEIRSSTVSP